uniref:Uncharacterized protein n=1 Tax=Strombidium inclinatum TaxID=197538 RepID=A0A7S3IUW3_9SPIT|mmetsp:Transcript_42019/g.64363  ORF Transcript_42019/g.64363 Transcript_42019/m.64363 type:complete len:106 (+) Transcript_42019:1896-2213(+)
MKRQEELDLQNERQDGQLNIVHEADGEDEDVHYFAKKQPSAFENLDNLVGGVTDEPVKYNESMEQQFRATSQSGKFRDANGMLMHHAPNDVGFNSKYEEEKKEEY